MRQAINDVVVAVVVLSVSLFFLIHLWRSSGGTWGPAEPSMVPAIVIFAIALLSTILLIGSLARLRLVSRSQRPDRPRLRPAERVSFRGAGFIGWSIAYLAALPWLGYLLATGTYIGGMALLFGNRRPVTILLLMILTPIALLLFFERYMVILLPSGSIFS